MIDSLRSSDNKLIEKLKIFSPVQIIVFSFIFIIAIGTVALTLPFCSRSGSSTDFLSALFTSTSCTCVTGLSLFDTWSHWSAIGQIVILILIQTGGLGLVSFTTGFTLIMRKRLGLRDMKIVKESVSGNVINVPKLITTILISTFIFEIIGTLLLCARFVPKYGIYGMWLSLFLSISSYCNAGFDITGFISPGSSLLEFNDDPFIMFVISMLIIIGGIGFVVIVEIYTYFTDNFGKKERIPNLSLHATIVIRTSLILLVLGSLVFIICEYNNTLSGLNLPQKFMASFLQSSSARTAGMFSIDMESQHNITKFFTIMLMFVGASPSSTGGGIKTVTLVIVLWTIISTLKGRDDTVILGKRIEKSVVYRSFSITVLSVIVILISSIIISLLEVGHDLKSIDVVYETVSALSTTGLSVGITPLLSKFSKFILIILMFMGRVGPISLILSIMSNKISHKNSMLPEGKVIIG